MVDFSDYLDMEIFMSVSYWFLTIGTLAALLIGFSFQESWGGSSMSIINQILTLLLIPVASYFIVLWQMNR